MHQDLSWLWDHVWLSALPVLAGLVIALPLGWLANRYHWLYPPVLSIAGLLYTIPSLALFVLVPPLFGLKALDPLQVPIALTVYSVALLVRVVADGLASVPDDVVQAATAMGFGPLPAAGQGRTADRRPCHRGRPARGHGGEREFGGHRRHDRPGQPRASCSLPASSCRRRRRTTRRSCWASFCALPLRSPST